MAKFRKEIDPARQAAFFNREEHRRAANRSVGSDPVLVCEQCGWKIRDSARKARGITACQRCGSKQCRVHNLDYNEIRLPARPDVNTILAQEQQAMRRTGRR